jgi:hypothetical protein
VRGETLKTLPCGQFKCLFTYKSLDTKVPSQLSGTCNERYLRICNGLLRGLLAATVCSSVLQQCSTSSAGESDQLIFDQRGDLCYGRCGILIIARIQTHKKLEREIQICTLGGWGERIEVFHQLLVPIFLSCCITKLERQ